MSTVSEVRYYLAKDQVQGISLAVQEVHPPIHDHSLRANKIDADESMAYREEFKQRGKFTLYYEWMNMEPKR